MPWQEPKTNWTAADGVADVDFNRIEGNAQALKDIVDTGAMIQQPTPPEGTLEGRLWLDTSEEADHDLIVTQLQQDVVDLQNITSSHDNAITSIETFNSAITLEVTQLENQTTQLIAEVADIAYLPNTGTVDAIVLNKTGFTLANGNYVEWQQTGANTGTVTINVTNTGIKDLRNTDGTALASGDLEIGFYRAIYDSAQGFFVLAPRGNGAKITGQGEAVVNYFENINKGDLVTIRRYFGFDTPIKLPNPDVLYTTTSNCNASSQDGKYIAMGGSYTPYILIYKRNGDLLTKLPNPTTLPSSTVTNLAFSPDGKYLAALYNSAPFMILYKIDSAMDTFSVIPTITGLSNLYSGGGLFCLFSPDSRYLILTCQQLSYKSYVYIISIDSLTDTFTWLSTTLVAEILGICFNGTGDKIFITPKGTTVYKYFTFTDGTLGTETDGLGVGFNPQGCAVSPDNKYLIIGGFNTTNIAILKSDDGGNTYSIIADPDVIPQGFTRNCCFTSDGKYLAVSHTTTPFISIYKVTSATDTFTKLANPTVLPTGAGNWASFSNTEPFLSVSHATSPYLTVYKADILGDFAHLYTGVNDLYKSNYINFGYAKSTGLANDTNKKVVTLPIK